MNNSSTIYYNTKTILGFLPNSREFHKFTYKFFILFHTLFVLFHCKYHFSCTICIILKHLLIKVLVLREQESKNMKNSFVRRVIRDRTSVGASGKTGSKKGWVSVNLPGRKAFQPLLTRLSHRFDLSHACHRLDCA